jgi:hypothetical protein
MNESLLAPKGRRAVATGEAARRRSRPTRNPWNGDTSISASPRRGEGFPRQKKTSPILSTGCASLHPWLQACAPTGRRITQRPYGVGEIPLPLRGRSEVGRLVPRVALRFTRGYRSAPLRGDEPRSAPSGRGASPLPLRSKGDFASHPGRFLAPEGPRAVATGEAARRRSRPTRNPWMSFVFSRLAPEGRRIPGAEENIPDLLHGLRFASPRARAGRRSGAPPCSGTGPAAAPRLPWHRGRRRSPHGAASCSAHAHAPALRVRAHPPPGADAWANEQSPGRRLSAPPPRSGRDASSARP